MSVRAYLLSRDRFWVRALAQLQPGTVPLEIAPLALDARGSLEHLPPAGPRALAILDATGDCDLAGIIDQLAGSGWKNVVVVAADPSTKEALLVLRDHPTYDYWKKTYDPGKIRAKLEAYLQEMDLDGDE